MKARTKLSYDGPRGQCILLLLAALGELGGRSTRREVFAHIARQHYFTTEREDELPFPSAVQPEPRWELLMAYAWRACVEWQCVTEAESGVSLLTPEGAEVYARTVKLLQDGTFDAGRCFFWTAEFKRRLVPAYAPPPGERQRPATLYHDLERQLLAFASA